MPMPIYQVTIVETRTKTYLIEGPDLPSVVEDATKHALSSKWGNLGKEKVVRHIVSVIEDSK